MTGARVDAAARPQEFRLYIGGEWVKAAEGRSFVVQDPYDTRPCGPRGRRADARRAIGGHEAFAAWYGAPAGGSGFPARGGMEGGTSCRALLAGRRLHLRSACSNGLHAGCSARRQARPARPDHPLRRPAPSPGPAPAVGVVGAIARRTQLILSLPIAAPIALGNTVVLKPSEWCRSRAASGAKASPKPACPRRPEHRDPRAEEAAAVAGELAGTRRYAAWASPAPPPRAGSWRRRQAGTGRVVPSWAATTHSSAGRRGPDSRSTPPPFGSSWSDLHAQRIASSSAPIANVPRPAGH
jgi:hypothetical protein